MKKGEFEQLRLLAQKCDHRGMAPEISFDIAADLRANRGRGGRMFEKRRYRTDKFIYDDNSPELEGSSQTKPVHRHLGPKPFVSNQYFSSVDQLDRVNKNVRGGGFPDNQMTVDNEEEDRDPFENLTEAERLHKLYKILHYTPSEPLLPVRPLAFQGPKSDLRGTAYIPMTLGRNFNKSARGWRNTAAGDLFYTERELPMDTPAQPVSSTHSHYYSAYQDVPDTLSPQGQGLLQLGNYRTENKTWQPMEMSPQDEMIYGDFNPRPKAWQSVQYEGNSAHSEIPYGDYNPRPKAWRSSEKDDDSVQEDIMYGDYNARPKAWEGTEADHYHVSPADVHYGDYNAKAKAWQASGAEHRSPPDQVKYGDYNAKPKAWKTSRLRMLQNQQNKVRYGDYNARAKGWQSVYIEDSEDTSSTSSDDHAVYLYRLRGVNFSPKEIPASDL